jgi:iron complex transport system substrate-binding protein
MALRIVSLIASSTEIVCALGFEKELVGRSHECDYPKSVLRLPACTAPKLDVGASSLEIDRQVKFLVASAVSVYKVDVEKLRELKPEVIVTQTQCEVCAVSLKDVEAALGEGLDCSPKLVPLQPNALEDVWADIQRVADALGAGPQGTQLTARLKERMRRTAVRAKVLPRTSVACIEWIDPLMAAGNWMPELVEMAGGRDLFGQAGKHSPWMEYEKLRTQDPEFIVILPCGFDIARAKSEMPALTRKPGWKKLKAVKKGRVYLADGNQYFNRPGPRLADSLDILAEILHPEVFPPEHQGAGWQRWGA